jgi:hypothetical protein
MCCSYVPHLGPHGRGSALAVTLSPRELHALRMLRKSVRRGVRPEECSHVTKKSVSASHVMKIEKAE